MQPSTNSKGLVKPDKARRMCVERLLWILVIPCFSFSCGLGVTRLADISLNDPVSISVADELQKVPEPASQTDREASSSSNCMEQENFAVPETLQQYVMMVPSKLRLVTLAAFILQKCKVRLCLHLYY